MRNMSQDYEQRIAELEAKNHVLQQQLAQHQADTTINKLPGVVFRLRLQGNNQREFLSVSERSREIYALEPDEFAQMFARIHPDDLQDFEIAIQNSARSLTRLQHEHRIVLPNHSIQWVKVIAQPEQQDEKTIVWDGLIIESGDRQTAEVQLRQSEERFRSLVETLSDWIWECDHTGVLTYSSPQVEKILGYTPAEIIDKTAFELMSPEEAERVRPMFEQKIVNQAPLEQIENTNLHKDGYPVVLETSGVPILDNEGNLVGYRGIDRDISQRKQSEERLQQKEMQYRQVFETITDGLGIINLNTSNLMEANPAYAQMHGYSHEDFMVIPLAHHVHPDSIPILNQFVMEIQAGRPFTCTAQNVHRDGHVIDIEVTGTPYPYQGEIHALTLVRDVTNQVKLETERRCQAEALRESSELIYQQVRREKLLNQLTNQIRNSLDLQEIINTTIREIQSFLNIDRCHFAWYVRDIRSAYWDVISEVQNSDLPSFIGQHNVTNFGALSELLLRQQVIRLDDSSTVADSAVKETLKTLGNKSMMVLPVRAKSGKFGIIACIHCQQVRPWQNDEVELLTAVVDQLVIALNQSDLLAQSKSRATELEQLITQLKQTQLQLVQSEKMSGLGQLVAGVAHEINNPVNFIHGNIDHAQNYIQDLLSVLDLYEHHYPQPHAEILAEIAEVDLDFLKEDATNLFQSMQVGTERIREIVRSLRIFSRLDEAEIKAVDLHEGLDSTLTILKTRLRDQKWRTAIQIIKNYGDLPLIECYAGQLNQVFMNIISNAIDALDDQDRDRTLEQQESDPNTIQIQTQVIGQTLQIQITDNGPGIPGEVQARLFDPFFTTKAVGKGTGLGLSISYQIITDKHQGKLTCASQPGATTFCIQIPLQRTDKSVLARSRPNPHSS